jgi:hypothetical protein
MYFTMISIIITTLSTCSHYKVIINIYQMNRCNQLEVDIMNLNSLHARTKPMNIKVKTYEHDRPNLILLPIVSELGQNYWYS